MAKDPAAGARVWTVEVRVAGKVWAAGAWGAAGAWAAAKGVAAVGWAVRWRPARAGVVYAPTVGNRVVMLLGSRAIR